MDSSRTVKRAFSGGLVAVAAAVALVAACDNGDGSLPLGSGNGDPNANETGNGTPEPTELDDRVVDYNEALRTASLKLVDVSPTLSQIRRVQNAGDKKAEYEALVDEMLADPRFSRRMIRLWRDIFRQGGEGFDTAPVFAARLVVEGKPFTDMFTATENTCPSYDGETETFVDGNCDNGVPQHAGVLTNPGAMAQFYGNMAFRRVRWVQEVFACAKFPAEHSGDPQAMGNGQYTSPWPFLSIASEPIDFQDTSAVVCANCHTTMNHLAPLFGNFDANGTWQTTIQVMTPTAPEPTTTDLAHWLQPGEETSWRMGVPVADLPALGKVLADDPAVIQCVTARFWNFVMSKEDIVDGLATVPTEVIEPHLQVLVSSNYNLKATLRSMMTGEDFVSF
jgi:hypothetical protein